LNHYLNEINIKTKGPYALSFSLEGNSPLERIHIPILGTIRHFVEVNIHKEHILNIIFNIDYQKYLTSFLKNIIISIKHGKI